MKSNEYPITMEKVQELKIQYPYSISELCSALDQPVWEGSVRRAKKNHLSRFCEFEVTGKGKGTRYIIKEIFDQEEPDIGNSLYTQSIKIQLLQIMQNGSGEEIHSAPQWFQALGMVNRSYIELRKNPDKPCKGVKYPNLGLGDYFENCIRWNNDIFLNRTSRYMRAVLIRALKVLQNAQVLSFHDDCFMLYFYDDDLHVYTSRRKATKEEQKVIMDARKEILIQLDFDDIQQVYALGFGVTKGFFKKVNKLLRESFGDSFAFSTQEIQVICSKTYLDYQIDRELEKAKRLELNEKILDWCDNKNAISFINNLSNYKYDSKDRMKYYRLDVQRALSAECIALKN